MIRHVIGYLKAIASSLWRWNKVVSILLLMDKMCGRMETFAYMEHRKFTSHGVHLGEKCETNGSLVCINNA